MNQCVTTSTCVSAKIPKAFAKQKRRRGITFFGGSGNAFFPHFPIHNLFIATLMREETSKCLRTKQIPSQRSAIFESWSECRSLGESIRWHLGRCVHYSLGRIFGRSIGTQVPSPDGVTDAGSASKSDTDTACQTIEI
jgi:hypothetical protein